MQQHKVKLPLQIRFVDFDTLGHVNNANYLSYFEMARIHYFEQIIAGGRINWKEDGIILAKAIIDFRKPINDFQDYFISISCVRIGTKSFDFNYLITQEKGNEEEVIAEGTTVMVCFNYVSQQTIAMKPEWKEAISRFEEKDF